MFQRPAAHTTVRTLALLPLIGFIACSDDDDDPTPPLQAASTYSASFDRAQETSATTLGTTIRVTVRNQAPEMGTFQTPVWLGVHDGTFDIYDLGTPASPALERIAEDGNFAPLAADFAASGAGDFDAVILGQTFASAGPIPPGESASILIRLDPSAGPLYLSYASMVIPSNDAFVANGDPMAHQIYDGSGAFQPTSFVVAAAEALDAGTEFNDEVAANTAFFGQSAPNTGTTTTDNIALHPGFLAAGMSGILDDPMFANADFANTVGYEFLEVTVTEVSPIAEPTGVASAALNAAGDTLTYDLTAIGLSGEVTGFHLHEGAAGSSGGVLFDLLGTATINEGGKFQAAGSITVTSTAQVDLLQAGNTYFNVHTTLNAGGEIRGQVLQGEVFGTPVDMAQESPAPILGENVKVIVQNSAPKWVPSKPRFGWVCTTVRSTCTTWAPWRASAWSASQRMATQPT